MTRTGHPRAWHAARAHRAAGLAAVVMLLALAAGLFVSAGSPHHNLGGRLATAAAAEIGETASAVRAADHEHHHGTDWTPTLGQRLRPVAALGVVCTLAAGPFAVRPVAVTTAAPASPFSGRSGLLLLSILRV